MRLIEITFESNGFRKSTKIETLDYFEGKWVDQIVLVNFERGWRQDTLPSFLYMLRSGDKVSFLEGICEIKEFSTLNQELKRLFPNINTICELK